MNRSEEDIIKTAYEYFQSYDYKNEPIPADLMAMIEAIDGVKSLDELLKLDAKLVTDYGTTGFFELTAGVNPLKPTERVIQFNQLSGVLKTSFEEIEEGNYVINSISKDAQMVLTTRGYDKETAEKHGKALALLAKEIGTDPLMVDGVVVELLRNDLYSDQELLKELQLRSLKILDKVVKYV